MTAPYSPDQPLTHTATDEQILRRETAIYATIRPDNTHSFAREMTTLRLVYEFGNARVAHAVAEKDAEIVRLRKAMQMWATKYDEATAYNVVLMGKVAAAEQDAGRLDLILSRSALCMTEDGDQLCLYVGGENNERQMPVAVVADLGCDTDEAITKDEAPWLTDAERAFLNGEAPHDPAIITADTLRRALDAARAATPEKELPDAR